MKAKILEDLCLYTTDDVDDNILGRIRIPSMALD